MANGFQLDVPYSGWEAANQGLSGIGSGLGQWARQQQALQLAERQRQNELQDAIALFTIKSRIEEDATQKATAERLKQFPEMLRSLGLSEETSPVGNVTPVISGASRVGKFVPSGEDISPFVVKPSVSFDPMTGTSRVSFQQVANPLFMERQRDIRREKAIASFKEKEDIRRTEKAKRDLDLYSSDAMQSLIALNKIQGQASNLPEFGRGIGTQIVAKARAGLGRFGKDREITRYLGVISQELIPAARKLMEEKGPITESDVERVEAGLGDLTTPLEDKIFLLNEFRNKIKQALINKMEVSGTSEEDFSGKYKSLYQNLFAGEQAPQRQIPFGESREGPFTPTPEILPSSSYQSPLEIGLSKAESIRNRSSFGQRMLGKFQAGLPSLGQFVGGMGGAMLSKNRLGGIAGGTFGRVAGRFGQLAIGQIAKNPMKFLEGFGKEGIVSVLTNATPEQREFVKNEFLGTLASETLFSGLGAVGEKAVKGVASELLGEEVAKRGFEGGFKRMLDPKFRSGRVPQEIAIKADKFFDRLRDVTGKGVDEAINQKAIANKAISTDIVAKGLTEIRDRLGKVDELSEAVSPAQKKLIKKQLAEITERLKKSKGITIKELWNRRREVDKILYGRRWSAEADDYLKSVRKLLNNPVRNASPDVAKNFDRYSFVMDVQDEIGKKMEARALEGEVFAGKTERFAGTLLRTSKNEQMAELHKLDSLLRVDDKVIEDLLDLASAEELNKKIGAVGLGGKVAAGILGGRRATAQALGGAQTPIGRGTRRAFGRFIPTAASELLFPGGQ